MFDIMNQNVYEEEWGDDYFSSSSEDNWVFDDLDDQFVEVANPQFIETMLCHDGAPLNALIDLHSELLLKPIDTPIKIHEEKILATPSPIIEEIQVFEERKTTGGKSLKKLFEAEENKQTRKNVGGKTLINPPELQRKNTGGKSLKLIQETFNREKSQQQRKNKGGKTLKKNDKTSKKMSHIELSFSEEIEIDIEEEEEEEEPVISTNNKKKRKSLPNKPSSKKNKTESQEINVDTPPSEMIYDILTNDLDTPHKKASTLERTISKVFMGEKILKIMKNDEEDEDIDSI